MSTCFDCPNRSRCEIMGWDYDPSCSYFSSRGGETKQTPQGAVYSPVPTGVTVGKGGVRGQNFGTRGNEGGAEPPSISDINLLTAMVQKAEAGLQKACKLITECVSRPPCETQQDWLCPDVHCDGTGACLEECWKVYLEA